MTRGTFLLELHALNILNNSTIFLWNLISIIRNSKIVKVWSSLRGAKKGTFMVDEKWLFLSDTHECAYFILNKKMGKESLPRWSYILHETNSTQTRLAQAVCTRDSPLVNVPRKAPTSPLKVRASFQDLPSTSTLDETWSLDGVAPSNMIKFRCFHNSHMTRMRIAHASFLLQHVPILSWHHSGRVWFPAGIHSCLPMALLDFLSTWA